MSEISLRKFLEARTRELQAFADDWEMNMRENGEADWPSNLSFDDWAEQEREFLDVLRESS